MTENYLTSSKVLINNSASTILRAHRNTQRNVVIRSGSLITNSTNTTTGVSARVYDNGVYGFSSDAEYSTESVMKVLSAANANAVFLSARTGLTGHKFPPISKYEFYSDIPSVTTNQHVLIELSQAADAYISSKYKNLTSRTVRAFEGTTQRRLLCSDYGEVFANTHTVLSRSNMLISLVATTSLGLPVSLYDAISCEGLFENLSNNLSALYKMIDNLYESLMQKREGVYPDAGVKTCILGSSLSGILAHEAVGHTVEADMVLSGSVASNCLNAQVASPIVNLVDFANTAFGVPVPLPLYVDDEGTPAQDAVIIKDGILTGYMHNRASAEHFGAVPCGNARAYDFSDEPLIRMRNTAILPGRDKLADMIASIDDGYYLIKAGNGQADTTGEFMFGVNMGYEIKHGRIGRAILNTTISGVAFDMLKTIDMLGDTIGWTSVGYCGKKQPMPVGMGGPALRCRVMIGGR